MFFYYYTLIGSRIQRQKLIQSETKAAALLHKFSRVLGRTGICNTIGSFHDLTLLW